MQLIDCEKNDNGVKSFAEDNNNKRSCPQSFVNNLRDESNHEHVSSKAISIILKDNDDTDSSANGKKAKFE